MQSFIHMTITEVVRKFRPQRVISHAAVIPHNNLQSALDSGYINFANFFAAIVAWHERRR